MPPLPVVLDVVLHAVLPALGLAAAVMAAVLLLGGEKQAPLAAALGLSAGVAVGLWLRDAVILVPGTSAWNRLPWLALAALWVGRVARLPQLEPGAGWFLRATTAAAWAWVVIPASTRQEIDWVTPVFAVLVLLHWVLLERVAVEFPGGSVPLCLALVYFAAAAVLIHSGSARLTDVAIVLGSAFAGLAAVAWWRRTEIGGAIPAVALLLPGLLLMGQQETFSEVPWLAFALPALALLLLAEVLVLGPCQTIRQRRLRVLLMVGLVLVPLLAAVGLALSKGSLEFE